MARKKAIIVACFYSYSFPTRLQYFENVLTELGYDCIFLAADFDHRTKSQFQLSKEDVKLIHVTPYKKNLSIRRIYSHIEFAMNAYREALRYEPDLIYVGSPPNSNVKIFGKYKEKFPQTKLILSISDMWPETFPIQGKVKKLLKPFFDFWARIRNVNLSNYDGIVYECDLFRNHLKQFCKETPTETIYMSKRDSLNYNSELLDRSFVNQHCIKFAYIGSVNNIVDIDLIVDFLKKMNQRKSIELVLIGTGENVCRLVDLCESNNILVNNCGAVFDEGRKEELLRGCHYGLNIMKESVFVGATMKSLEYLYFGLPLINSIQGDTYRIVEKNCCGVNISWDNIDEIAEVLSELQAEEYVHMSYNARKVFLAYFSEESVRSKIKKFFGEILELSNL